MRKMKTFSELIDLEELNDEYEAQQGDFVRPLPFVSSNRTMWKFGVITKVFGEALPSDALPEVWITTNDGKTIVEYSNYIYPLTACKDDR